MSFNLARSDEKLTIFRTVVGQATNNGGDIERELTKQLIIK
jgi:hypothetical protein